MRTRLAMVLVVLGALGCEGAGPDPAEHCGARDEITCAEDIGGWIPAGLSGTTGLGDGTYDGSRCGVGGGTAVDDRAFRFTAPRDGTYRFTTEGSSFDTVLSVRRGSCAGRETTCNDDATDGVTFSSVSLALSACETVTLVVDGHDADGVGDFVLGIDTSEASCSDGIDDDEDGLVDCDDPDCAGPRCDVASGMWPEDWATLERGVLDAVNEHRAMGAVCDGETMPPVGPLARDVLLELAARNHSLDMAENDYFSHDSLDGRTLGDRVAEVGFESTFVGENIAMSYDTVEAVMAGWMSSPGHCRNIMTAGYTVLGVGVASPNGVPYWTQDFGGGI